MVSPRLSRYSIGLSAPSEILIRFSLYQRMYESTTSMNWSVLTWREPRKVTKSLTVQYDRVMYLLDDTPDNRKLIDRYTQYARYQVSPRRTAASTAARGARQSNMRTTLSCGRRRHLRR